MTSALPQLPKLPEPADNPLSRAMYEIADALQYPVDHRGRCYDVRYLVPVLAYHLARVGCVIDPTRAVVKMQRVAPPNEILGTPLAEAWDAVTWVHPDEPQSIDDELHGATLDDIPRMSAAARAEFIRRAGGTPQGETFTPPTDDELADRTPWHVETHIHFDDEEQS